MHFVLEWDALAKIRYDQIASGRDLTFNKILLPALLKLIGNRPVKQILDAGCGVGILTQALASHAEVVMGVDPSAVSIGIAQSINDTRTGFVCSTLEEFADQSDLTFDLVVANMVLMDVPALDPFVRALHKVLVPGGRFLFSLTHPWFWPIYYGYAHEPWFRYDDELFIEGPFRISQDQYRGLPTTHIHRPLHIYMEAFCRATLSVEVLLEPMPSSEIAALYPKPWKTPRYLVGVCRRAS